MIKYILIFLFCFNILFAEQEENKSSELELFLFKIGFDGILKDVEINREKSSLNEKEIKVINEKIELIMNELYENKRVLLNDSKEASPINKSGVDIQKEMQKIRSEIALIKEEIETLKNEKVETKKSDLLKVEETKIEIEKNDLLEVKKEEKAKNESAGLEKIEIEKSAFINTKEETTNEAQKKFKEVKVKRDGTRVRQKPTPASEILYEVNKDTVLFLEYCDSFGWCKIKDKEEFIAEQVVYE